MSVLREIPPTAGWPLHAKDILLFNENSHEGSLELDFKNYLDVEYVKVLNTATAALYLILETLKDISGKKTVIIPSFICPLVPLAVKKAGLNIEVCDVTGTDFNYDLNALENTCSRDNDILAVIAAHIGGIPVDLDPIIRMSEKCGAFVIEDCAQALGARYKNRLVGTMGDFSMFSLGRGKGLTIYQGGIAVANKRGHALLLENKIAQLVKNDFLAESVKILELLGYWIFYRPQLFWSVFKLPQVFWLMQGDKLKAYTDYFEIDFPVHRVSFIRKYAGHAGFHNLETEINKQKQKAAYYINNLKGVNGLRLVTEMPGTEAVYPYVTLIYDEPERRERAWNALKDSGLGVSGVYSFAITDFDYLKDIVPGGDPAGGRSLAKNSITLSTSMFLGEEDLSYIVNQIKKL